TGNFRQLLLELFEALDVPSPHGGLRQRCPGWVITYRETNPLNESGLVVNALYLFEINLDAAASCQLQRRGGNSYNPASSKKFGQGRKCTRDRIHLFQLLLWIATDRYGGFQVRFRILHKVTEGNFVLFATCLAQPSLHLVPDEAVFGRVTGFVFVQTLQLLGPFLRRNLLLFLQFS